MGKRWSWGRHPKSLLIILAVATLLRTIWVFLVPVKPVSDSGVYDLLGRNIASGIGFAWAPGIPTAHWPVGTAFVYAVFYYFFGLSYVPILVFNVVISIGTIWLTMLLAERWFNWNVAILAGFIMAIWPVQIEFTSILASELIFNFLLVAWLAVWELATFNRWVKAILLGVIASATCYIRPVGLIVPIILCVLEILRDRKFVRPVLSMGIIFAVMAILIAPWSIRNTRIYGHFVQISTNGGVNLWEGNNPTGEGQTQAIPPDAMKMQEADRDIYLGKIAKDYIRQYPGRFVVRTLKKVIWLYDHETIGVHWNPGLVTAFGEGVIWPLKLISDLFWLAVLFLSLFGVSLVIVERGVWATFTFVPIVIWCYFTALYSVFVVQDRYHFPTLPFIAVLAAVAIATLRERGGWRLTRNRIRSAIEGAPNIADQAQASSATVPVISVFSGLSEDWKWYEEEIRGKARFDFYTEEPRTLLERSIQRPRLSRMTGAFRCVASAKRMSSVAVAAFSQYNTMWAAFALRLLDVRVPLLSFSFHFAKLPRGVRLRLLKWTFSRVERFLVHSEAERERYSRHFGISVDRFDLVRWGVQLSSVQIEAAPSPLPKPYICALGKDGRDYRTLIEAMRQLPDLTLIVVALPYNLGGVAIPENVRIHCDIPREEALNILKHSQFMALPLEGNETSCGHITLVSAMFYRKAIVATDSTGIADYFPQGYDAPKVGAGDVDGWVAALRVMANDAARRERCAISGEAFSLQYCSHEAAYRGTMDVFRKAGIAIG